MDVLAHALWSTAGGIAGRRKLHWRVHLGWLAAWSVLPDLAVFAIPAAIRISRFLTGASQTLLPDGSGPRFDWAFGIYNVTHSAVVWALCFGAVWLMARRPVLELLGWALHIAIDSFTHTGIFAVKFLWPLSSDHFDGIRWETPWFLATTYAALAAVFLMLWIRAEDPPAVRGFADRIPHDVGFNPSVHGPAVVIDLFAPEVRRNPWPVYDRLRAESPVLHVPPPFNGWMVFDYETVKWIMTDHATFSSRIPAPSFSFIFTDPPEHSRLRNLISCAFTPRAIADLEPAICEISKELFDNTIAAGQMEFAADFSAPLAMRVIAGMIGIAPEDWPRYKRWNDKMLGLTHTRSGGDQAQQAMRDFNTATTEMSAYLAETIVERRKSPQNDLLTRLLEAEVDGDRLTHEEILAFFRLLMFAGQETTTNLLNNAVVCFLDHPDQLTKLRNAPQLLPSAIEEVLRYRSPFQWAMRTPLRDVEVHGTVIPKGAFLLPVGGAANRDPKRFPNPNTFDIARDPNPHLAFGHGIHFCLGAALARLEARIALSDLLARFESFAYASEEPWPPREGLIAHGPASLPIRFEVKRTQPASA